jgi:DDE superfamily endonuclease
VIIDKNQGSLGHSVEGTKGEWITVIECVSAEGVALPPFVIFKGKHLQSNWFQPNTPHDWMITTSPKGWTNNGLGFNWLQNHFEPLTRPINKTKYRILILDGHGSHLTPEFETFCKDHRIILLCLPAHTSHMLQPLDVSVFSSLKHWYRRAIDSRLRLGDTRIPKAEFLSLYSEIRDKAMTINNIQSGFRKTGLVPYNPAAVLRQLPTTPIKTPNPTVLPGLQTPKCPSEITKALDMLGNSDSTPVRVGRKIGRAAMALHTKATVLEVECRDLLAHNKRIREATSRKRKRVPGNGPRLVGEALDALETIPRKKPNTRSTQRRRASTPLSDSESDAGSLEGITDEDINSCIIAIA